jgi:hypothetical protein
MIHKRCFVNRKNDIGRLIHAFKFLLFDVVEERVAADTKKYTKACNKK